MDKTVGILGGGQLGRMLTEAANRLNIRVLTLDAANSPAKQIAAHAAHITGSFTSPSAIRTLASRVSLLTLEIEHVDADVLEELSEGHSTTPDWRRIGGPKVVVQPSWRTIKVIQDKFLQKQHLSERGIPTARSVAIEDEKEGYVEGVERVVEELGGLPVMLKARTEAYDGRGNFAVRARGQIPEALVALGGRPLYAERWADFECELAVIVVKVREEADLDWEEATLAYGVVETVHEDSICKLVYAPAQTEWVVRQRARTLARKAVAGFWGKGIFGVEMFLFKDGEILINEIAPRPHNSGHYTIEACPVSQFEAHLRAILDLPLCAADLEADRAAVMLNILGGADPDAHLEVAKRALSIPRAAVHLYGKGGGRPGRKMGHVTVTAPSMDIKIPKQNIQPLIKLVDKIRADATTAPAPKPTAPPKASRPLVAVTMGSDSDLKTLKPGIDLLKEFGVLHGVTVKSAHRTADEMAAFAKGAASKGIKVIIAGAGGAAHLPGMVAANTTLPVVGVPVRGSNLEGMDSLLSIVQMPAGCPVATMAINNSRNAALYGIRILALTDEVIKGQLESWMDDEKDSVIRKNEKLQQMGYEEYFRAM